MHSPAFSDAVREAAQERIAVFDLDGTLTRHDTFIPYITGFIAPRPGRWPALLRIVLAFFLFALRLCDRQQLKERVIVASLSGERRSTIDAYNKRFVPKLLKGGMHPEALAALEEHRIRGDRLVLLSASPDIYVPSIAGGLGFHECFCTEVSWNADTLAGPLRTANRRGEEKARILLTLRERGPSMIFAYGNSGSDLPHLQLADRGVLINGSAGARKFAGSLGVECRNWR